MTATPKTDGGSGAVPDDGQVERPDPRDPRARWAATAAVVAGAVALVCAALLAFLPVSVDRPVVSWPADPASPEPTSLQLTTQRPLALDARIDCAAARSAEASADGLALTTMPLQSVDTPGSALVATVRGGQLSVVSRGVPLASIPLPAGACEIAIVGDQQGIAVLLDGRAVGRAGPEVLPDIDALTTSVAPTSPGTSAGLAVRVTVDDQFASSPTPIKVVVTVLLVLAVVAVFVALVVRDRAARRHVGRERRSRWPRPAASDAVVGAVLVAWTFLAPMTDDDGYYSAMAANVPFNGYVANYYQLYNQGFTPFTWIYYVLSAWQTGVGTSPVLLRVPSLLLAVLSWVLLRAFVARALPAGPGRGRAIALHAALAVGFLAWWLPYSMGVRPEAVVATSVVASMLAISVGLERDRWALLGVGVGVASFGATAAPTGFVALAPLLAGLPAIWRRLALDGSTVRTVARLIAIGGPGAIVGLLAFADGSLRDFLRAQQIFLGMQSQETWYTEIVRWSFLLSSGPMGNFAKRAPVLIGLLALACALALVALLRHRAQPVPARASYAATTLLLGFALLWLTPSKWTHHFGTLAAVGGAVIALAIVAAPVLLRDIAIREPSRPPVRASVLVGVGLLLAALAALAGHGRNVWPYSWLLGLPDAGRSPTVAFVSFDQPLWWIVGGALVAGAAVLITRRYATSWRPVAGVVAISVTACVVLVATLVFLVGGFAYAAARTAGSWSPWADAVRDPLGRDCVAAGQMQVLDPASAVPMSPAPGLSSPTSPTPPAFVPGGWFPSTSPPFEQDREAGRPTAAVGEAWGSFAPPPAGSQGAPAGFDGTVGTFATPWYTIPDRPDAAMTTSVSGRTGDGNSLTVEYARVQGGVPIQVGRAELGLDPDGEAVTSLVWRGLLLEQGNGPPPGATVMRLVAQDTSTARGGWLAFTAPTVQRWTGLQDYARPGEASAVSWQYAFLFPCQRKPVQAAGINEPSTVGVVWGDQQAAMRFDGIWQIGRGGMFAQSLRDSQVSGLVTRLRDAPDASAGTVYRLTPYIPRDGAYRLDRESEVVAGWSPAPNTTMSRPVDDVSATE